MLIVHSTTAIAASRLPESRGMKLGKATEELTVPSDEPDSTTKTMELI